MTRVLKGSHSFTCTSHVHPVTKWTIPDFVFPAEAGTHLATQEGWKAELALVLTNYKCHCPSAHLYLHTSCAPWQKWGPAWAPSTPNGIKFIQIVAKLHSRRKYQLSVDRSTILAEMPFPVSQRRDKTPSKVVSRLRVCNTWGINNSAFTVRRALWVQWWATN